MARHTPSEALVETLVAHGVTDIFGIMGSAFMDAMDIFGPAGIRFIPVVHEQGAAHMADGYSRASGRHGVCIGQNGPGISNCVTGIAAAYWAHSPVVIITPEIGTSGLGLGGFQEANQLPMFQEFTKYQAHVNNVNRIAEFTGRCFDRALSEMGPTQLNIPRDLFYGDIDIEIPKPILVDRGPGGAKSLEQAAELLAGSRFPVFISGGGVVNAGAIRECKALAETFGAPVISSYLHNDSFPASHSLYCGPIGYQGSKAAMNLLSKADVVLAIGTRLGPFGTLPQYGMEYWPESAKIIQIDADHKVLGLTKQIAVGICGDAKEAIIALGNIISTRTLACNASRSDRENCIQNEKKNWDRELADWKHEDDAYSREVIAEANESQLHPRQVLRELERAMPVNAMVSTDVGNICSIANSYLRFEQGRSFFAAMSYGNCGYAFPAIIGAKAAAPDRPAVAYVGDGAWGMSMGEIMTCVREDIPTTAIVFNNGQWGAEKKNQVDFYGKRFVAGDLENPSFAEIARAMGARGVTITHLDDVAPALTDSVNAQLADGVTTVVEIMCTKELGEPFRRDALRKPIRFLEKYRDYT